jgi:hypothetical protein
LSKAPSLQTPIGPTVVYVPVIQQAGVSPVDAGMRPSVFTGASGRAGMGVSGAQIQSEIQGIMKDLPSNLHVVPIGSVNGSEALVLGIEGDCPNCGIHFKTESKTEEKPVQSATDEQSKTAQPVAPVAKDAPFMVDIRSRGKGGKIDMSGGQGGGFISSITTPDELKEKQGIQQLDPKLIERLKSVAQAFPGKTINVNRTWGGGESEHAKGKAVDFSVQGVSKEDLFKTLYKQNKTGGLGYYSDPTVPFVHMDVRDKSETWVDKSASGKSSDYVGKPEGAKNTNMTVVNEYLKTKLGIEKPRGVE